MLPVFHPSQISWLVLTLSKYCNFSTYLHTKVDPILITLLKQLKQNAPFMIQNRKWANFTCRSLSIQKIHVCFWPLGRSGDTLGPDQEWEAPRSSKPADHGLYKCPWNNNTKDQLLTAFQKQCSMALPQLYLILICVFSHWVWNSTTYI